MNILDSVRRILPEKYRQFAKFLIVGGTTWVIDTVIFFTLKHTVLTEKVITAKIIAILVAMIVNYVLNREWSFSDRGGRERHHEAALFFVLNAIGVGINLLPLWVSHYLLGFRAPAYSPFTETVADFIAGSLIGTILAMAFRYWAYQKWVFPEVLEEGLDPQTAPVLENELTYNIPPHPHPNQHPQDTTAPRTTAPRTVPEPPAR